MSLKNPSRATTVVDLPNQNSDALFMISIPNSMSIKIARDGPATPEFSELPDHPWITHPISFLDHRNNNGLVDLPNQNSDALFMISIPNRGPSIQLEMALKLLGGYQLYQNDLASFSENCQVNGLGMKLGFSS